MKHVRIAAMVLAVCLLVVCQSVALAQNLGAAPQVNVAVQGQTGAQPEGAFLNFVNWVGNVIAPVGAGVAVVGGIVSYASRPGLSPLDRDGSGPPDRVRPDPIAGVLDRAGHRRCFLGPITMVGRMARRFLHGCGKARACTLKAECKGADSSQGDRLQLSLTSRFKNREGGFSQALFIWGCVLPPAQSATAIGSLCASNTAHAAIPPLSVLSLPHASRNEQWFARWNGRQVVAPSKCRRRHRAGPRQTSAEDRAVKTTPRSLGPPVSSGCARQPGRSGGEL